MISSTSSTPPISITITNIIPVDSTYNHCKFLPKMISRKISTLRMHCTPAVCRLQVSATPLFIFISSYPIYFILNEFFVPPIRPVCCLWT